MTKKERIAQLEIQVADLRQEVVALKQIVALKQDRLIGYQPQVIPHPTYPSTNPSPPWVVTSMGAEQ